MNKTFIVNFVGKASPSTIKQLAETTHKNDGKWLISKVNFIEQQVAAVIKIELPEANEQAVKQAFTQNPDLLVQFLDSDHTQHDKEAIFRLRVDSSDRTGLVNDITHILEAQMINIIDMDCQRVFIAGGGGVSSGLFTASLVIQLPTQVTIKDVIRELESLDADTKVAHVTE